MKERSMGMTMGVPRIVAVAGLAAMLVLALLRPADHDESQYVAAALLVRDGAMPWRDFGWFQTPLQPLLWGPLTALFGSLAWPGLRLVNALAGWAAAIGVARAARAAGARPPVALTSACLFAATDIMLFGSGVARNDALAVMGLSLALTPLIRVARGEGGRGAAMLAGLLVGAAVAIKVSYAIPAVAIGLWALLDWRQRYPVSLMIGALPAAALTLMMAARAPEPFVFEVFTWPATAPRQFYLEIGAWWKLTLLGRTIDTIKFLALGAALPALMAIGARRPRGGAVPMLTLIALGGGIAAILPEPTWRHYLLPALPPIFVLLALAWTARPPMRAERIAFAFFVAAGLAPSVEGWLLGSGMPRAIADGAKVRAAMDGAGLAGPVFTLAPQMLAATGRSPDPRIANGPFYFRSHDLIDAAREQRWALLSEKRLPAATLPAVLIDVAALGGDAPLNRRLEAATLARGYVAVPVASPRWRLYRRP